MPIWSHPDTIGSILYRTVTVNQKLGAQKYSSMTMRVFEKVHKDLVWLVNVGVEQLVLHRAPNNVGMNWNAETVVKS